jgi:hypothetical protein
MVNAAARAFDTSFARPRSAAAECSTRYSPAGLNGSVCIFRTHARPLGPAPNKAAAIAHGRSAAW